MKKLLAVLLTAAMTLSMLVVPVTVSAETTTPATETVGYQAVKGTKTGSTTWTDTMELTENGTYYVATAADMTALATLVNNGPAKGSAILNNN